MKKVGEMKAGSASRSTIMLLLLQVLTLVVLPRSVFATESALSNSYFFTVTSNNELGVQSVDFAVVDANEPNPATLDIIPVPDAASNQGVVSLRVNAPENVAVAKAQFLVNGSMVAETVEYPHAFAWDTSTLSRGDYTVSVKAIDSAGNEAVSETVSVQVAGDITPPIVTLAAPVANGIASGTLALSASASDNVSVARIELYVDDVLVEARNESSIGYDLNTLTQANGSHVLSAKAYDAAGNIGYSAAVAVNVFNDTTPPAVSIVSPSDNSTIGGTVTVSAEASDNVAVAKVEFYENGALKSTVTSAPYNFIWNTTALADGTHTLAVKAYDAAGNLGQSSNVTVTVLNDTMAPTVNFVAPASNYIYGNSVNVAASATDNVAVTKMEMYVDGVLKYSNAGSSFNIPCNFTIGVHTIMVKAYDAANNVQIISKKVNRFL